MLVSRLGVEACHELHYAFCPDFYHRDRGDNLGIPSATQLSLVCPSLVNTEQNCLLSVSAFDFASASSFQPSLIGATPWLFCF